MSKLSLLGPIDVLSILGIGVILLDLISDGDLLFNSSFLDEFLFDFDAERLPRLFELDFVRFFDLDLFDFGFDFRLRSLCFAWTFVLMLVNIFVSDFIGFLGLEFEDFFDLDLDILFLLVDFNFFDRDRLFSDFSIIFSI